MTKTAPKPHRYQGLLRPKVEKDAIESDFCAEIVASRIQDRQPIRCEWPTINGDQWCYDCKDIQGYAERLQQVRDAAMAAWEAAHPRVVVVQMDLV